jgi:hypothetical protein
VGNKRDKLEKNADVLPEIVCYGEGSSLLNVEKRLTTVNSQYGRKQKTEGPDQCRRRPETYECN